jgi:Family of unknown function (DUF5984)
MLLCVALHAPGIIMLFEFELLPIEAITPWGTPPDLSLHWFGLTYGFYRLKIGDQYLLNYSNEIVEYWKHKYPNAKFSDRPTWADYQVVRLWEDVLDMLPYILEPLPKKLAAVLEKGDDQIAKWKDRLYARHRNPDAVSEATDWISQRCLNTWYLTAGPSIRFWSADRDVYIKWDNRACVIDGVPVWSAQHGMYHLPADEFLREVHSFHERLMNAMEERVATVLENGKNSAVQIDLAKLTKEQEERKQGLNQALARPRSKLEIEAALKMLSRNTRRVQRG